MNSVSSNLRIAVVTTHPPSRNTLNEYGFHLIKALRQKQEVAEIILLAEELSAGQDYSFEDSGVPVTVDACWKFGDVGNALRILAAVKRHKPDVVFFTIQFATFGPDKATAALGLLAPSMIKAAGYPTIVLLHNIMETVNLQSAGFVSNPIAASAIRQIGRWMTKLLLRADLVALTIPKYVEILEEEYGAENVILAPHGSFETPPPPSYDLPPGPQRIMTFGKFGTYKKVEKLIEATQLLRANGHPDSELIIAGTDSPNTPGYLHDIAQSCEIGDGISFTGYVEEEDVPGLFQDAAVVVFPYTSTTGSSGVLHQAGSYGKAAVLPNIGDFAELVQDEGYTGEFFEPDDTLSLKEAISRILDDPVRRQQIGQQNYGASCGLPISEVADWYLLHMQHLLEEKGNKK
jgi:glycosyltransferase involved in cell wall biosynthesis